MKKIKSFIDRITDRPFLDLFGTTISTYIFFFIGSVVGITFVEKTGGISGDWLNDNEKVYALLLYDGGFYLFYLFLEFITKILGAIFPTRENVKTNE